MFDISWGELILIGMVALIVIGPKELPTVLRTMGQWMTKVRRMASEFQGQFQEAMREAEFADLKKQVDAIGEGTNFNPIDAAKREFETAFDEKPKPAETTGASPATASVADASPSVPDTARADPTPAADAPPIPPASDPVIPPVEPAPPPIQSDFNPDRPADPAASQAGGGRAA